MSWARQVRTKVRTVSETGTCGLVERGAEGVLASVQGRVRRGATGAGQLRERRISGFPGGLAERGWKATRRGSAW